MKYPRRCISVVNILIVDDDAGARKTFGSILKAKGYDIDTAGTGEEALSKIRSLGYFPTKIRQKGGKTVYAWAVAGDIDPATMSAAPLAGL